MPAGANFAFWSYELQRRGYQLARLDSRDAVFVREEEPTHRLS